MVMAAKLLHSFDFLPNHALYVRNTLRVRLSAIDDTSQTLPAAHWTQLEKPTEVNSIIRKWLTELDAKQEHPRDEL